MTILLTLYTDEDLKWDRHPLRSEMPAFFNSFIGNVAIEVLDGTPLGVPFKIFNGVYCRVI